MNDYKATVLQLLADIGGGDPPANGPVLSDAQFRSEVLRLLSAMSGGGGGGGGASVLVVNVTEDGGVYTCDKTAEEMWAAVPLVCFKYKVDDADVIYCLVEAGHDEVNGYMFSDYNNQFVAASGTDYPTATSPI